MTFKLGGQNFKLEPNDCPLYVPDCPPYFNDVWRTRDGANWERVTAAADRAPHPGHQAMVLLNHFIRFVVWIEF